MAKKVTISVPDKLYEKMEKWRKSFNFSKIFQEAIGAAIEKKEGFQKRLKEDETMEQIVERLRKEREELEDDYHTEGKNEGLEWAKAVSYGELKAALDWDIYGRHIPEEIFDSIQNTIQQNPGLSWKDWMHREHSSETYTFMDGWKQGVEEFWEEIKDKL